MVEVKGREQWHSKLFRILNSAVCFSLAYIIITWLGYWAMGAMGKVFKFDANIYYYGIRFLLNNQKWTKLSVTFIYLTYPLFALVFGLLMLYIFDKGRKLRATMNVFFVWCFIIGTSMFSAQAFIASLGANEFNSPFYQNLAVVFAWWFIPPPVIYAFNLPFAALLIYFSINYPRHFMSFAYSYAKVNKMERRRKYFFETAIVPFIIGSVITTAVTFNMNLFIHAIYLLTIGVSLVISWVALFYIEILKDDVLHYKGLQKFGFLFVVALIFLVFFVKVFWRGIYFSL